MTRRICKVVSMMLILAMVIQLIPKRLFVQAETISLIPDVVSGTQADTGAQIGTSSEETPATIVGEIVEKRTENAKYFRMSDGSYSVAQYMYDVHFKTENGYVPYDNTLRAVRSGGTTTYQPARSDLGISFAGNDIQDGIFTFGRDGYTVSVALVDTHLSTSTKTVTASVQAKREAPVYENQWEAQMDMRDTVSAISYNNVLSDTTLSYTLLGSTIKESIILNQKPSKSSWKFKLTLNGLVAALQENGDVYLIAKDTKTVAYTIPKGYMFDANNYVSEDVTYTLESCKDGVYLTVHADAAWLNASDRVYPVTVDPTFWVGGNPSTAISDAHVLQGNPTLNTKWYNILMAGYSSGSTFLNMRTYLKIKTLPTLPDSAEITSATLQIKQVPSGQWYSYNSTKNYVHIGAYQVLSAWDDGTVTWNNQPSIETAPMDYITTTASTAEKLFKLNVTTAARSWYTSSNSNYGIVLHAEPETWKGQVSFISGDDVNGGNPCLYITYRDMRGVEDVYSYDQENAGNAGSGFVNLYTGNLVFAQGGMTSAGSILPIQVGLVYNGYQKGLPFTKNTNNVNAPNTHTFPMHTGYGWKLNLLETIQLKEIKTSSVVTTQYYVYNDGDGTEHWFKDYNTQFYPPEYLSEDGLQLTLSVLETGGYVLEDDQHNKKYFNTMGRLVTIEDFVGNVKKIQYNTAGYITKVVYTPAETEEEMNEFLLEYNSAGALVKVINGRDTSRYMEYLYADTYNGTPTAAGYKYLRGVRYSTGEEVTYTYFSDAALRAARDEQNKIEVQYTYSGTKVSQIDVLRGSGVTEDRRTFSYNDKQTLVRTKGADDIPGTVDDYLNAYTFDTYGRTVSRYVTNLTQDKLYGVGHTTYNNATNGSDLRKQNTIADQSSIGNLAQNLLRDGNCETLDPYISSWDYYDPADGYISCVSNQKYYGNYSFVISMSTPGTGSITQQYQAPTTGTYTLSAYVRASGVEPQTESDGAKILLNETSSLVLVDTTDWFLGWERLIVSRHYNAGETITVTLQLDDSCGEVYFDCVQLETGTSASAYNFLDDGDFDSNSTAWDVSGGDCNYLSNAGIDNSPCIDLIGGLLRASVLPQTIPMDLDLEGKVVTLFVSGWGKGKTSAHEGQSIYENLNDTYAGAERDFAISVVLKYQGEEKPETHLIQFNPAIWDEWQFTSGTIQLKTTGKLISVEISPYLRRNAKNVCFDNFSLIIGSTTEYTYDLDGYLTSVEDGSGNQQALTYTNHQVSSVKTHTNDETYAYEYYPENEEYRYQLMSAWYPNGTEVYFDEYDPYGNVTRQYIYPADSGEPYNELNYTYDYYGNFLATETNPHGTTVYDYNEATGILNYVRNANNNRTAYLYDASGKLLQVFADANKNGTKESSEQGVQYVYDTQNRLIRIVTASTTYHFTYNDFGQTTSITVGGRTTPLARYTYNAYGGKLICTDYADGTYITNTYDDHGRVQSVSYNGTIQYTVTYDGQGNVSSYTETSTGYEYRYDYDEIDRIRQHWIVSGDDILVQIDYIYQGDGRIEMINKSVCGLIEYPYWQLYDVYGNISELRTYYATVYLSYDSMNRIQQRRINHGGDIITTDYTYYTSGEITTDRVSSMKISLGDGTQTTFAYTYDALGNITAIDDGTEMRLYTYDALNQLTSEIIYTNSTKIGTKVTYSYDKAGNLVSKTNSVYNNGIVSNSTTDTYTYGDTTWGDLLTAYNGEGITYDANGNPLSYYNGKRYTFSWQYGRRLASLGVDGKTYTYTYNAEGLRITKTVNGVEHTYYYDGTELLMEEWGDCYLRFTYDEQGRPLSLFYYDGSKVNRYHSVLNLQGDVIAILDSFENVVCRYTYDAWGKILSVKDGSGNAIAAAEHIGNLNPLRYRGYYYDSETGLYYLRSRYYDPVICRFVNADNQLVTGDLVGMNLFAYCGNNSINKYDPTGHFALLVIAAVLLFTPVGGTALQVATSVVSYAGMATAAIFDEEVRDDMDAIGWNPFNEDEAATLNSNKVSFYKGVPVFKTVANNRPGSFGAIFLPEYCDADTLRHERGHNSQLMMMGIANFALMIGLPSWLEWSNREYEDRPWEVTAEEFGGVKGRTHSQTDINRGYWYLGVSSLFGPFGYFFLIGEF